LTSSVQVPARAIPMFDISPVLERARNRTSVNLAAMHAASRFILGDQARSFEEELAVSFGGDFAVGTGSGTAALELCLREAGVVRPQQEVIVPAFTSLFTAQAVLASGASLRLADVDPDSLLLTPESLERAWTPATAAVVCVHLYGHACRVDEIAELCRRRGATLIQDACQAHGLRYKGRPLTAFSSHTAYSFYPTKNLGCLGDGGAVVTNSRRVARRIRLLRDGGRDGDQVARAPGINSRLDEIHACYLRGFLPDLHGWTEHRRRIASHYEHNLRDCRAVRFVPFDAEAVHHLFVIRIGERDRLGRHLRSQGIEFGIHYPYPLHRQPAFRRRATWAKPPVHAETACREVLSLPIGPHVDEDAVEQVCTVVRNWSPC
jgi:dTDP-3-amino-3,4,6-trideoxy-alpha-D-glucose transaminase